MNPLASIIIPIYNSEDCIEKCVRSLFEQSYDTIEYIFIDDCSKGQETIILNTVLNDYPERKPFVKIIRHTENRGSASSRNDGLKEATGKYVTFCDSDDWIDSKGIEEVINYLEHSENDILMTDFFYEEEKGRTLQSQQFQGLNNIELTKALIVGSCHGSTCNKVYKRDFLLKSNQWFVDGADLYEDLCWNMRLFLLTDKIDCAPLSYYHYQMFNNNSIIHSQYGSDIERRNKSFWQVVTNYRVAIDFFKQSGYYDVVKDAMNQRQLNLRLRLTDTNDLYNTKLFKSLYPETNGLLLRLNRKLRWRIALFLLAYGITLPYEMLLKKGKFLTKYRNQSSSNKIDDKEPQNV